MATQSTKGFLGLPVELIDQICQEVSNDLNDESNRGRLGDLNNLAKTCSRLFHIALPTLYTRYSLYRGRSCLWWASAVDRVLTIRRAISTGYAVCDCDHLIRAIRYDHLEAIRLLLEVPSVLQTWKSRHFEGETPLSAAVLTGRTDLVRTCLAKNPMDPALRKDGNSTADFTLYLAVQANNIELTALILSHDVPIDALHNVYRGERRAPLHAAAAIAGHSGPVLVQMLIDHEANVNLRSTSGRVPLECAIDEENLEITRLLLHAGASLEDLSKAPLEHAVLCRDAGFLRLFMDHGVDLSDLGVAGHTPLSLAVEHCRWDVLQLLLELGQPSKLRIGPNEETLLHLAARQGSGTSIRILVNAGADVNARSTTGETPLHSLVSSDRRLDNKSWVAKYLLRAGADPMIRDADGQTILRASMRDYHPGAVVNEMLQVILETGVEVDARACMRLRQGALGRFEFRNMTAFEALAVGACSQSRERNGRSYFWENQRMAPFETLLGYGAHPDRGAGLCVLCCALDREDAAVMQLLVSHGVDFRIEDGLHIKHTHGVYDHYLANARQGYHDGLRSWLYRQGLEVRAADSSGRTCLHVLCTTPTSEASQVEFFVPYNDWPSSSAKLTFLNVQDSEGNTALHLASANDRLDILEELLRRLARLDVLNQAGESALDLALRLRRPRIVERLRAALENAERIRMSRLLEERPDLWYYAY